MKKRLLNTVYLLCCLFTAWGQAHDFRLLTRQDGLPGTEVLSLTRDAFGRMWMSGNASGVSYFDGKKMHRFTDTSAQSMIGYLMELKTAEGDSTVVIYHFERGICLVRNGKISRYRIEDYPILRGAALPNSGFTDGRIWGINAAGIAFEYDRVKDNFIEIGRVSLEKGSISGDFDYYAPTKTIFLDTQNGFVTKLLRGQLGGNWATLLAFDIRHEKPFADRNYVNSKGQLFSRTRKKVSRFDGQRWHNVPLPITPKNIAEPILFMTHRHGHFFLVLKKDANRRQVFEYNDDFQVLNTAIFTSRSIVTGVDKDFAGNFWIATMGGQFKVSPMFLNFFSQDNEDMVADLHAIGEDRNGQIWFGSYSEGLATFDGEKLTKNPTGTNPNWHFLPSSHRLPDGKLLMNLEELGSSIAVFDGKTWTKHLPNKSFFYTTALADGRLALGGAGGVGLAIQKKTGSAFHDSTDYQWITAVKGMNLKNVLSIAEDRLGRVWLGRTTQGIAVYDRKRDTAFTWLLQNAHTDFGAMAITTDHRGNVWFGTSKGIFFYETPTDNVGTTPQYFPNFNPFRDFKAVGKDIFDDMGHIHSLKIWHGKYLIVGSSIGFALIDIEQFYATNGKRFPIFSFDEKAGYSGGSTEQNAIMFDRNDDIWLGHDKGATRFNIKNYTFDTLMPPLSIDSIRDGKEVFVFKKSDNLTLNTGEQPVQIYISTPINALLTNDVLIKYRLSHKTEWSPLVATEMIDLHLLSPDKYTLEIVAIKNGLEAPPQYLTFRIPKIWYKNEGYLLLFLLIGGGIGVWFYRKQEQRKRAFALMRVQAIANQLNPHFINNTLNMIQLKSRNNPDAVDMIDRLSQNIQIVFRNTRNKKAYHLLADEFNLVRNYLHIQKYRSGEMLDFELPDEKIITQYKNIFLPLMSLQIHCENAIEHGIRNQKQGGKVIIRFDIDKPNFVHIVVEDTGIGREKAHQISSKGNQQGVKMLVEMAEITNLINAQKISYRYEDGIFTDGQGQLFGTRVHLYFPTIYNYELPE